MLRRLELIGFKSFADKTVFDFGDGITGIVGPNGSGKSNIVDAVRWILGEQSAKSLRGGEMADVIFNGSSTRRSVGLAEVTMTFDNRLHQLAIDQEEVQITRRVYRTGEGEYLINNQACRLKDIKDLFLGSGAGNDAYCIIAQGRVDALLQASTKERRTIFEEAAGISRFKAKKIESLRKLERVDLNLQRLRDIVDEVQKQLHSVKLQASKALRYQEHSTRLRDLRLALGLEEYELFSGRLGKEEAILQSLRDELDQRAARAGACDTEAERLEMHLADLDDQLREQEGSLGKALQQIGTEETTVAHERTLSGNLDSELQKTRRRLMDLSNHVAALAETQRHTLESLNTAQSQVDQQKTHLVTHEALLAETMSQYTTIQRQVAADKTLHLDQMKQAAHWQNESVANKAQLDHLCQASERLQQRSVQVNDNLATIDFELEKLLHDETKFNESQAQARLVLQEHKQTHERLVQVRERTTERLSTLRQEHSGRASRIDLLQHLISSHEGLGSGVREVIELLEQPDPGPWGNILGMIADFLTVKREYAPLIDLALGDWSQRFLVREIAQLAAAIAERPQPFTGRVSFLPLWSMHPDRSEDEAAIEALRGNRLVQVSLLSRVKQPGEIRPHELQTGLVAQAEHVVSCDHPELGDLPSQLLGRTLIVRDLATARNLARHAVGFRFVTLQGELLEPDGTITVGMHHAETGILSRKSELRELLMVQADLDVRLAELELDLQSLRAQIQNLETEWDDRQLELDILTGQVNDARTRIQRIRDRRQALHEDATHSQSEIQRLDLEIKKIELTFEEMHARAAEAEKQVQALQTRMHDADEKLRQIDHERQERQLAFTQARVTLARVEEQLHSLEAQHQKALHDYQQRQREWQQAQHALTSGQARWIESQRTILQSTAILAQVYLDKESAQGRIACLVAQRDAQRQERARLTQQAQAVRAQWHAHQEQMHQRELEATNLRHQRDTLVQRLAEDYQIDLAELDRQRQALKVGSNSESSEPRPVSDEAVSVQTTVLSILAAVTFPLDVTETQREIEDLRRKLGRLGSVNLDSLTELQELEERAGTLQAQFDDLISAKKSLEEIISKINLDSRQLFLDTFNAIRIHFQELFRKLFGGGMADVVLEDENDVLECGIEVIARPPGKELRSISLLSGGEKTMTAVALLLAIFRSKPSPFCLLDEVDAALDEANIGRFTSVLREFMDKSQFIIVTHSKKTMASADVLYGITMQESGISKQVTIRFEDWVDSDESSQHNEKQEVA